MAPEYPAMHLHVWRSTASVHVPPYSQGVLLHSFTSKTLQFLQIRRPDYWFAIENKQHRMWSNNVTITQPNLIRNGLICSYSTKPFVYRLSRRRAMVWPLTCHTFSDSPTVQVFLRLQNTMVNSAYSGRNVYCHGRFSAATFYSRWKTTSATSAALALFVPAAPVQVPSRVTASALTREVRVLSAPVLTATAFHLSTDESRCVHMSRRRQSDPRYPRQVTRVLPYMTSHSRHVVVMCCPRPWMCLLSFSWLLCTLVWFPTCWLHTGFSHSLLPAFWPCQGKLSESQIGLW